MVAMGISLAIHRYKKEQEAKKEDDVMDSESIIIPKCNSNTKTDNHYMSGEDLGYCNRADNIRTFNKWR